jgi:hypothetical protein
MKLPKLRLAYCLLPLLALPQPAIAITNSRSLPSDFTNPRLISQPNHRSIASAQVIIDSEAIRVGSQNRKNFLKNCSEETPCIEDKIVIESYKEAVDSNGNINGANLSLYNPSPAPAVIEVYSSKGELKSLEPIDGVKPGFKDFPDLFQTTASGLIEPFKCASKGSKKCWNQFRYNTYEVKKNEVSLKLKPGDIIRISRGSDAAHAYTLASTNIDMLELMVSLGGIIKSNKTGLPLTNLRYSSELKREIIKGFLREKVGGKYTWSMLLKELGQDSYKKSFNDPSQLFNNSLEILKNVPDDFWKATSNGTIASRAAGDGFEALFEAVGGKASTIVKSALFFSQSVNIAARYYASDFAHQKPVNIVISIDNTKSSNTPITSIPQQPSPLLKKAIASSVFSDVYPNIDIEYWRNYKPPFSFTEIDLNNDGISEVIVLYRLRNCFNRGCYVDVFKSNQKKSYDFIAQSYTSRGTLEVGLLPTKSYGWQDLAVQQFSYETRTTDWYAVKFNGRTYEVDLQRLSQPPKKIILSEKSNEFDLGNLPLSQVGFENYKIDFVKSFNNTSRCSYWLADSKHNKSNDIFRVYNQSREGKAIAKIDGREIDLYRFEQKSESNYTRVVYKGLSLKVEVTDYFHSSKVKPPVSISFIYNGYRKTVKANYECNN